MRDSFLPKHDFSQRIGICQAVPDVLVPFRASDGPDGGHAGKTQEGWHRSAMRMIINRASRGVAA